MAAVVTVISDLHIGSTVGLCPAGVALDDGGTYTLTKAQRWLGVKWDEMWGKVDRLREVAGPGAQHILVVNGDIVDGDHHGTFQVVTRNPVTMIKMAVQVLDPVLQNHGVDKLYVTRGTPAHVGESGWMEEAVARDLGAEVDPIANTHSFWSLLLAVDGVKFDIAHHGRMGRRPWTWPKAGADLAAEISAAYGQRRQPAPHVAVRSHMHKFTESGNTVFGVRGVTTPAWQLATAYVNKFNPNDLAHIGMVSFVVEGGSYAMHPLVVEAEARRWISVKTN